ncbi:hypothetical protein Premu_1813 [Hallella multisaccharivorax DSM 17128]|uniref:Uncharacterized protein n=1 Tax=Hallella multisaccharivorax DSM 17128 TaxID=688246 RepID=F8N634_9BACT|nr:hypothetical protein Premu_1813 [Hallella multisaccharivorax DSM 17128]
MVEYPLMTKLISNDKPSQRDTRIQAKEPHICPLSKGDAPCLTRAYKKMLWRKVTPVAPVCVCVCVCVCVLAKYLS